MLQEFFAMLWDVFVFIAGLAIVLWLVSFFFFGSTFVGGESENKSQFKKKY